MSCTEISDIGSDYYDDPKLVISCVISPETDTCYIVLSKSIPLGTGINNYDDHVTLLEAYIKSTDNDTLRFQPLAEMKNTYFVPSSGFFKEDSIYELYVSSVDCGDIIALTHIPKMETGVVNIHFTESYIENTYWGLADYSILGEWPDNQAFYLLEYRLAYKQDSIYRTGFIPYFKLNHVDGNIHISYTRSVAIKENSEFGLLDCRLYSTDEHLKSYIDHHFLFINYQEGYLTMINPTGYLPDPGNITGGYGVFGSFVRNRINIEIL